MLVIPRASILLLLALLLLPSAEQDAGPSGPVDVGRPKGLVHLDVVLVAGRAKEDGQRRFGR